MLTRCSCTKSFKPAPPRRPSVKSRERKIYACRTSDLRAQRWRAAGPHGRQAKSTISRDVKSSRTSATRNADGSLLVDPAELHRVFPAVLRHEADLLREQPADPDETSRERRTRLTSELEERRRMLALLTGPWVINTGFEAFGVLLAAVVLMTLREE